MDSLVNLVKDRMSKATGLSVGELKQIAFETRTVLHDPFLYDDMDNLITQLHDFAEVQKRGPSKLLIVDTDYDTDGVMSAAVLSASLSVFGFNYRVYAPLMSDGYGLSKAAISKMKHQFEDANHQIGLILTADNGTNACAGVDYAHSLNIPVLVTDHHLTTFENSSADAMVNPNKKMPNGESEPYPFHGNAGGAVIWKTMLAYATKYQPDKFDLIYDLIVFAGIANVADVMPILDENHFMVRQAVGEIKRLFSIRDAGFTGYTQVKNTPYPHYNAIFHGLYDLIDGLQTSKDAKRAEKGKKPWPLARDEELISWYIAPMINATRRISSTCLTSMQALLALNPDLRKYAVQKMLVMNDEKTQLRNDVVDSIDFEAEKAFEASTILANTKHGISGLVAGVLTQKLHHASIVFAFPSKLTTDVYSDSDIDELITQHPNLVISASARSIPEQPLDKIMAIIRQTDPDLIVGGGGHAMAAGYAIHLRDFKRFRLLFNDVAMAVRKKIVKETKEAIANGSLQAPVVNAVNLAFSDHSMLDLPLVNVRKLSNFGKQLMLVYRLQASLKPFGHDFDAQTVFYFTFKPSDLLDYGLDFSFWKTFKASIDNVEILTFDIDLAKRVKDAVSRHTDEVITTKAKLNLNKFYGHEKLQLQLVAA